MLASLISSVSGLLAHPAKFVNMFRAANLHRRVPPGLYVKKRKETDEAKRETTHTHTQNQGSSVSTCKGMCLEVLP